MYIYRIISKKFIDLTVILYQLFLYFAELRSFNIMEINILISDLKAFFGGINGH